ncbi:hypothetical protein INT45_008805 [Circinella minor]|uniref:Uncharacterized protein n=1 Tax=Circinella minor TaxID=1195481 RepID=A0A8H7VAU3_9FUNG|nr:hypothetical protein INT45_008805 [Circinella minor]
MNRTTWIMQGLYEKGQELIARNERTLANELCRRYSFHLIGSAFWKLPQPQFNIYEAIVVDDLHQIGGVYKHILNFVETHICSKYRKKAIVDINKRAASLPTFKGHRRFDKGLFLSSLTNPTYNELRGYMTIILPCIYDYIEP